jgi:leucyl-tRNA synthetase
MVLKDGAVMSKSKGNIVDPDAIIKRYGADTLRLYILFAGPPEAEMEWSDKAIEGSWRFLNRVWRLVESIRVSEYQSIRGADTEDIKALERKTHQTIKKVTEDIEGFQFNTAISAIMELVNAVYAEWSSSGSDASASRRDSKEVSTFGTAYSLQLKEVAEIIVLLLSPFAPHACEEMWELLGHKGGIFKTRWPGYDQQALKDRETVIVVQVNGKIRSKINVPSGTPEARLKELALADTAVQKWTEGRPPKNFIVVPDKLINIVV